VEVDSRDLVEDSVADIELVDSVVDTVVLVDTLMPVGTDWDRQVVADMRPWVDHIHMEVAQEVDSNTL